MRFRRFARGLVLFIGALAGLLVFSELASARTVAGRQPGSTRSSGSQDSASGSGVQKPGVGAGVVQPSPAPGGVSPPSSQAGDASVTPSVRRFVDDAGSAPVVKEQPAVVYTPTVGQAVTPPSPRLPLRDAVRSNRSRRIGDFVSGQNTSDGATAISGDVDVVNDLVVDAGPVNGSQIGDNRIRVVQDSFAGSGDAVAGSQVFAGVRDNFFDDGDNFFFDDPFFDDRGDFFDHDPFFRRGFFFRPSVSDASLLRLEILSDMAHDCLDRLRDDPSFARLQICRHLVERVASESFAGGSFFNPFFDDVFFSRGNSHALIGWGGAAFSSHGVSTLVGPLGVSVVGHGSATTFGFGGFATTGGGVASGGGSALLAPFGTWWDPFDGGFDQFRHVPSFVSFWSLDSEIDFLERVLDATDDRIAWLEHQQDILWTIHSHSFFSPWWTSGLTLGHETVFISDDNVFVPNDDFFFDSFGTHSDSVWDRDWSWDGSWFRDSDWSWDLDSAFSRSNLRFHHRRCSPFRCTRRGPVLDLPGIELGARRSLL